MVLSDNIDLKNFNIQANGTKKEVFELVYLIEEVARKNLGKKEIDDAISLLEKGKAEEVIIHFSTIKTMKLTKKGFAMYSETGNPQFYFSTLKKVYTDAKKIFDEKHSKK